MEGSLCEWFIEFIILFKKKKAYYDISMLCLIYNVLGVLRIQIISPKL